MAGAGPAPQSAGQVSSLSFFLQRTVVLLSLLTLHQRAAANTIDAGDSQFELSPSSAWSTQGGALHTTQNGASATVNVGGTDFQVIGDVGPNRGKVQIQLDGQFFEVDTKNPTDVSSVVLWSGKALDPHHVFKVVVVQDDSDGKPVDIRKIQFTPDATDGSENAVDDRGQSSIFSSFTPGSAVATSEPPSQSSTANAGVTTTTTSSSSSSTSSSSSSSSSAAAAASSAAVSSAAQTSADANSVSSSAAAVAAASTSSSSSSGSANNNGVLLPPASSASDPAAANAGTAAGTSIPPSRSSSTIVAVAVAVPLGALLIGLAALFGYRRWSAQRRQRLEDDERRLSNFFTAGIRNGSSTGHGSYGEGGMRQVGPASSFGGSRPASWYSDSATSSVAPELDQDDLEALAARSEVGASQRSSRVKSLGSIVRFKWPGAFRGFAKGGDDA